ncbi:hypothetical protein FRZ03_09105 [Streptomyces misionensis]|uniref:Uncharacterized protein n=1 Tax=Streptomyces misionensis TaxID=67331 RepID=A0A5C6JY54_9ACTN|nr:hypothetical protein FRZ03_09105 [Streptomyces misionensis]
MGEQSGRGHGGPSKVIGGRPAGRGASCAGHVTHRRFTPRGLPSPSVFRRPAAAGGSPRSRRGTARRG